MRFEWDTKKNKSNIEKHGVSFEQAKHVFYDVNRIVNLDIKHSNSKEQRFFCFGKIELGIITVRFTLIDDSIRIFGAGFWREGRKEYEKENRV